MGVGDIGVKFQTEMQEVRGRGDMLDKWMENFEEIKVDFGAAKREMDAAIKSLKEQEAADIAVRASLEKGATGSERPAPSNSRKTAAGTGNRKTVAEFLGEDFTVLESS